MDRITTMLGRIVVYLLGAAALAVCFILLPELAREESLGKSPQAQMMLYPFLLGAYILAIPFFVGLYHAFKLLQLIDAKKAFTKQAIRTLQQIKFCAIVFSVLIIISVITGLSLARLADPREDITFMITFGFLCTSVASVVAVFVAVLQKLVADAVSVKSENDLIV